MMILASACVWAGAAFARQPEVAGQPDGGTRGAEPPAPQPDGSAPGASAAAANAAPSESLAGPSMPGDSATVRPGDGAPAGGVAPIAAPMSESAFQVDVHAFVSQGYVRNFRNNFLVDAMGRGSVQFNEVGINFTKNLTDRLRAGIQLFTRQIGDVGDYAPKADWFYLDYRFADWLGLRAGRTKLPFGLYNEVNDVDSARVPILLPQSVYPVLNRDIILAQTGAELYGFVRLGVVGALEYRLYGGTIYVPPPVAPAPLLLSSFKVPYMAGGRLMWEPPVEGLRLGGSVQALRFDTTYSTPPPSAGMPRGVLTIDIPFVLWLASAEYAAHDLLLAAEYGRWHADVESNMAPTNKVTNERFYVMASYRFVPWFTPGAYYAMLVPNVDKRDGQANYRHDLAVTLRFDVNSYWLFKAEGHLMRGTAELTPALNDNVTADKLDRDWAMFLLKTTVYF